MESKDTEVKDNSLVVVVKNGVYPALVVRVVRSAENFPIYIVVDDKGKETTVVPADIFFLAQTDGTFKTPSQAVQRLWEKVLIGLVGQLASTLKEDGLTTPEIQQNSLVIVPKGAADDVLNPCIGLVTKIFPDKKVLVKIGWRRSITADPKNLIHIIDTDGKTERPAKVLKIYQPQIIILLWTKLQILEMIRRARMLAVSQPDLQALLPIYFGPKTDSPLG